MGLRNGVGGALVHSRHLRPRPRGQILRRPQQPTGRLCRHRAMTGRRGGRIRRGSRGIAPHETVTERNVGARTAPPQRVDCRRLSSRPQMRGRRSPQSKECLCRNRTTMAWRGGDSSTACIGVALSVHHKSVVSSVREGPRSIQRPRPQVWRVRRGSSPQARRGRRGSRPKVSRPIRHKVSRPISSRHKVSRPISSRHKVSRPISSRHKVSRRGAAGDWNRIGRKPFRMSTVQMGHGPSSSVSSGHFASLDGLS
jgi:hypothetical protein